MREITVSTEVVRSGDLTNSGALPSGCDIAVVGKMEMHGGRLDGFGLKVLLSSRAEHLIAQEARQTGKTRGEVLGYLLDLSLYDQR